MPESMKAMATKGTCRWCAKPIVKADGAPDLRKTWHPACVTDYKIACSSSDQRRAVYARDKGVCARCGRDTDAERRGHFRRLTYHNTGKLWQADHIKPLIDLQTLCTKPCHVEKGKEDNRRRKAALEGPPLL